MCERMYKYLRFCLVVIILTKLLRGEIVTVGTGFFVMLDIIVLNYSDMFRFFHSCRLPEVLEKFVYQSIYEPNRSFVSLCLQYIYQFKGIAIEPFTCDICSLRLGNHDYDLQYKTSNECSCSSIHSMHVCQYCIRMDLRSQILGDQRVSTLRCLGRKCNLDDRFVRTRIGNDSKVITLLDRNQIEEAISNTAINKKIATKKESEKFWRCPSPDCTYVAFVDNKNHTPSTLQSVFSFVCSAFSTTSCKDPRKVTCPECKISSCHCCYAVWTKGIVDHMHQSCEIHKMKLEKLSKADNKAFEQWASEKGSTKVKPCPLCHSLIEKNAGCIHMTCRCKYEFCWNCERQWVRGHNMACRDRPVASNSTSTIQNANNRRNPMIAWLFGN